jgi:hypothetical protein
MWFYLIFLLYIVYISTSKKKKINKIVINSIDIKNNVENFFKKKKNYNILINLTKNSKKYITIPELIDNITNPESTYFDQNIYDFFVEKQNYFTKTHFSIDYETNCDSIISITDSINNKYLYGYPFLNFLKWTIQYKIVHNLNEKNKVNS